MTETWSNPAVTRHQLGGERYTSPDFFAREWDTMWTRTWQLLGREQAMPNPGDYQIEDVGPESIIMVRQPDGSIRAFYNVCQHRGSRLTFAAEGTTNAFICPYPAGLMPLMGHSPTHKTPRTSQSIRAIICDWLRSPATPSPGSCG